MPEPHADNRREDRLTLPSCETCRTNGHVRAISRTDYAVYFRCAKCTQIFSRPKPRSHLGTT